MILDEQARAYGLDPIDLLTEPAWKVMLRHTVRATAIKAVGEHTGGAEG